MGGKSAFRNWHVEAYLEGRADEIPADLLPKVKEIAERRVAESAQLTDVPADASDGQEKRPAGWGEV